MVNMVNNESFFRCGGGLFLPSLKARGFLARFL